MPRLTAREPSMKNPDVHLSSAVRETPESVRCEFCEGQGIIMRAFALAGKDAVTVYPNTIRYGCENGHKFARAALRRARGEA